MAPPAYIGCRQVLLLLSLLALFVSVSFSDDASSSLQPHSSGNNIRRRMLELDAEIEEEDSSSSYKPPLKKKSPKNNTKLIKPSTTKTNKLVSPKNQTKTIKSNNDIKLSNSTKNQTKLTDKSLKKLNSSSTLIKAKKLNSTSKSTNTKSSSLDPLLKSSSKNKTTKATATKAINNISSSKNDVASLDKTESEPKVKKTNTKKKSPPSNNDDNFPFEQDENDDVLMLSEFKDLPIKFQKTLIPDLERISTTSKAYITKANKEITKGFKPYVGNKYAPTIATLLSCAFVLIPLLLVSLLFNRIKAYFSLQKLLIFIQAYLSIYFSILCLSSLLTGLEPLRFFYATSQSTYVCLQVLQTLAYVLYLLLLVMYLLLVFSTDCGVGSRLLGLAQTFVGFSVGLHYYMTVFHRVVLKQAPKTNWKVHGIYAVCFLVICLVARADRRKKTYLEESGDEGKKN